MKYTSGQFKTGFGKDGKDGDTTFTQVGDRGRVYLPLAGEGPLSAALSAEADRHAEPAAVRQRRAAARS